jgi:hypothetical protein
MAQRAMAGGEVLGLQVHDPVSKFFGAHALAQLFNGAAQPKRQKVRMAQIRLGG